MTTISPSSPDDPFCTCPGCGLAGHHHVSITTAEPLRREVGQDGDIIEITTWGSPPPGTPIARRQCVFCDHSWTTDGNPQ